MPNQTKIPTEDTHADLILVSAMIEGDWDEVARMARKLEEQGAEGIRPSEIQVFDCNPTDRPHA